MHSHIFTIILNANCSHTLIHYTAVSLWEKPNEVTEATYQAVIEQLTSRVTSCYNLSRTLSMTRDTPLT